MDTHVRILAVIQITFGAIGVLIALGCLLLFGSLAGFVGSVAVRDDPNAWIGAWVLGILAVGIFFIVGILSIPSIIGGIGLLKLRNWARILTIVICALGLLNVPIGTAVGVYGLWVLLSGETEALFQRHQIRQVA